MAITACRSSRDLEDTRTSFALDQGLDALGEGLADGLSDLLGVFLAQALTQWANQLVELA